MPSAPGVHCVAAHVWRPRGSLFDRVAAFFIGGYPALKERKLIFGILSEGGGSLMRGMGRERLVTAGGGTVHLSLSVLTQELPPAEA